MEIKIGHTTEAPRKEQLLWAGIAKERPPRVDETCSEPEKTGIWRAKLEGTEDKALCLMGAEGESFWREGGLERGDDQG